MEEEEEEEEEEEVEEEEGEGEEEKEEELFPNSALLTLDLTKTFCWNFIYFFSVHLFKVKLVT